MHLQKIVTHAGAPVADYRLSCVQNNLELLLVHLLFHDARFSRDADVCLACFPQLLFVRFFYLEDLAVHVLLHLSPRFRKLTLLLLVDICSLQQKLKKVER